MTMTALSNTDVALVTLLRRSLCGSEESVALTAEEWRVLILRAYASGVSSLGYDGFLSLKEGDSVRDSMQAHLPAAWSMLFEEKQAACRQAAVARARLSSAFREARLPHLFLNTASYQDYPSPTLREGEAVEFLIDRADRPACERVLSALGIQAFKDSDGVSYIMHDILSVQIADEQAAARLRSLLARALDTVDNVALNDCTLSVPSLPVRALLLLLDAKIALDEGRLSLSLLLDFGMLTESHFRERDMHTTLSSWKQCGLLDTAKLLAAAASKLLALPPLDWFADIDECKADEVIALALSPSEAMLLKAEDALQAAICMEEARIEEERRANRLTARTAAKASEMKRHALDSARKRYPAVKKHPVLLIGALPCDLILNGLSSCLPSKKKQKQASKSSDSTHERRKTK